jgi:DUF2934 family protein
MPAFSEKGPARRSLTVETDLLRHLPISGFTADLQEATRRRAEEIYVQSGRVPGRDVENWTQAEREMREQVEKRNRRAAIIVKVNGAKYVGEYCPDTADGYVPGEIGAGSSVAVRLKGDKMYVKRPNGKELETTIVQKIR